MLRASCQVAAGIFQVASGPGEPLQLALCPGELLVRFGAAAGLCELLCGLTQLELLLNKYTVRI